MDLTLWELPVFIELTDFISLCNGQMGQLLNIICTRDIKEV